MWSSRPSWPRQEGPLISVYLEICGRCLFAGKSGPLPLGVLEATGAKEHKVEVGLDWQRGVAEARAGHGGRETVADLVGSEVA